MMKDQAMHMRRSRKTYGWMGLGSMFGLLVFMSVAFAQTTIHKNAFESKPGWSKGGYDAPFEEIAHKIDEREPHNGQGSEYIEIEAKQGEYIYYAYPVNKAVVNEELRAALWLRANRPGIQLMARLVLPNERDPNNLEYRMTTYIRGDIYQQTGRWQMLEIGRPVSLTKNQQHLMTKKLNRNIDFTGVYIEALVLNLYAGPGSTQVWIDDLEIGPVLSGSPFQSAIRPDNNTPVRPTTIPRPTQRGSVVDFSGNRLTVANKRLFFRAIRYTDTMLSVLRNAGFNTVCLDRNVNQAVVNEATDLGMWIAPEFRVTNDDGSALASEDITRQIQRYSDNDAIIFRRLGGMLSYEQVSMVHKGLTVARAADPNHFIAADVWDGLMPYSRTVNLVGIHRWPLMTTLELPRYREWLESRKNLANPGAFTWTWIQTHLPDWYAEMLYNQSPLAEFREPVGPQPEHVRLMTYTALSSGCRGLAYWSDRFLADSHQGRDRLLCCALLNQEMDMLESLLVTVDEAPQWIETSVPEVRAAVMRCPQGVLVMPIWQGKFAQFVPGQAAANKVSIIVPQVPKTTQAWEISPGDVRSLKVDRVERGLKVTLPEFGLTSTIMFTADTQLMGRFQDQARSRRQLAAQWSYDMAMYELEKVIYVQGQLEQAGATLPDGQSLIEDSKKRLQKSKEQWEARNFSAAYHEAQRALRPVRILMRAHWEKAVRGMDSPASSPYAVSFYTLPKHWAFMDQVNRSNVGSNVLPGGDFEMIPERTQSSWRLDSPSLDEVDLTAERVTDVKGVKNEKTNEPEPTKPIEGRQCLMMQMRPRPGRTIPVSLERSLVALTSRDVKLPPGSLVQISGWISVPAQITASPDGALMYDSAGGEPMAIRLTDAAPWKKYTVYRRVPASGNIHVTLALTGMGTVYFDDIRIEPLTPNGTAPGKTSGR